MLSPADFDLSVLPPAERAVVEEYLRRRALQSKGNLFLDYVQHVAPWVVIEEVHCLLAHHFEMLRDRQVDRLMVSMPPRTGKSLFTSILLPSWWEGHFPSDKLLHASYASTLVEKFGRQIRNQIMAPDYQQVFPRTQITKDSRAAAQWGTIGGGEYNAVGVGGGVAGKGGNLLVIDDPMSEQDMFSKSVMDSIYEWYGAGFYTRRQPDRNAVLITMCMTGDTPVLMASRAEKLLKDIRPGDQVATYENGKLSITRVLNHKTSGCDSIFTLRTRSGRILRANERHPFLVEHEGERKWMRLRELQVGANLVSLKGVSDTPDQTLRQDYALRASQETCTTGKTLTRKNVLQGTKVGGLVKRACTMAAQSLLVAKVCAQNTTTKLSGHQGTDPKGTHQKTAATCGLKIATELPKRISTLCSQLKAAFVQFVGNLLPNTTPAHIGTASCASTTVTTPMRFEGYSATTATSQLGTQRPQQPQTLWLDTSDFTTDPIVEIFPCGEEEVFDVEIERTENFIANGVVSHNTRWNRADLVGRLLADAVTKPDADQWVQLVIPAILDQEAADLLNKYSNDPHITQPHHYRPGDSFSPRRWPLHELIRTKNTISRKAWAALYLQSPVEEGGGILRQEDWKPWKSEALPEFDFILQSYDTAFEEGEENDYSVRTTWGIFKRASDNRLCAMVLERWMERAAFPNLLENALEAYRAYKPDRIIVEKAASGIPLIQEMRKRGIPVSPIKPQGSKIARANAAAVVLEQGVVYYPEGKRWAGDLVDNCAAFPNSLHDDDVDSTVHALNYFRRMFLLETPDDEEPDEDDDLDKTSKRGYAHRRSRLSVAA